MEKTVKQIEQPFSRGAGKYTADYLSDDIYDYYCEKTGNKYDKTKSEFLDIVKELNDSKFYFMVNKAWTFKMPSRLGTLRVKKKKVLFRLKEDGELDTKYLKLDYKATKDLWKSDPIAAMNKELIFHFNEHSDGYKFPWFWDKKTSNAIHQAFYNIIITRTHNRDKARAIKEDNKLDYFE